ncbi:MAG: NADH-quinone oxidoreductase subunit J [Acidobacteriota bacterium]|nr:NADH-quinone oxidoreductase subunit J [Blastocatellia bacterium]MDW8412762.1 NADH-quinone oxidoreductase subunit J [Acidobacteriota bacterium]
MEKVLFLILAGISVAAAINVIFQRNTLYSAFSLIAVFGCLAALYVMLQAQLIAALQIIVYAGAIMVLFVFVIMLLNIRQEEEQKDRYHLYYLSLPIGVLLALEVYYGLSNIQDVSVPGAAVGNAESLGQGLFSTYLLPFEVTSILILLAIVGAVVLARKERDIPLEMLDALEAEQAKNKQSGKSEGKENN